MNEKWPRWIAASITTHFKSAVGTDFPMFIEGVTPRSTTRAKTPFFELRVDGPWFTQRGKNDWEAYVEVNVLVQVPINKIAGAHNIYLIHDKVGIIAATFSDLPIMTYGETDVVQLTCMRVLQEEREAIKINHFGQIEPAVETLQATVEAHYTAELRN